MITLNGKKINITHFPDRTCQVWKVEGIEDENCEIVWDYENDMEIFHLCQLLSLHTACSIKNDTPDRKATVFIPYMPYARQDKDVDNEQTFALETLMGIFFMFTYNIHIKTVDIHSNKILEFVHEELYTNLYPISLIERIQKYDVLIFPDKGAKERYSDLFGDIKSYSLTKVRNQQTGEITHMEFNEADVDITGASVAVVDDICDGGRTFIGVSDAIDQLSQSIAKKDLVITHGIFSNLELLCKLNTKCYDEVIFSDSLYTDFDLKIAAHYNLLYKAMNDYINNKKMTMLPCLPAIEFKIG